MEYMLFHIFYIAPAPTKFGRSKPSQQYCLKMGKQKATLKLVLDTELKIM